MKKHYIIFLLLLGIKLAASDTHHQLTQKLPEMLQQLEQQINKKQENIKSPSSKLTAFAPLLYLAGVPLAFCEGNLRLACIPFLIVGTKGSMRHFVELPKEKKELEILEQKKAELLKKLKDMESK